MIEQGRYYYEHEDEIYRENTMAENFIREYDKLSGGDIMGIYGGAHTDLEGTDYMTNTVPCIANQLEKRYGSALITEDLCLLVKDAEPVRIDKIKIAGKEYEATYFGKQEVPYISQDYKYIEFWWVKDAYNDFRDNRITGGYGEQNAYPMIIEGGQVYILDITKTDGSVVRQYHRTDENVQGMLQSRKNL